MDVILAGIVPALAGIVIGIFSGLLGIGGGTLMVPLFRLIFGMSPIMSTATSLFAIVPTSLSGAASHMRNKTICLPLGLVLGIGGACTSALGVWLATFSPGWAIMSGTACVIAYSAISMFTKAIRYTPDKKEDQPEDRKKTTFTGKQLALGFFIGLVVGVVSGFVGVGGGFIFIPLMLSVFHLSMKQASGTSLVAVLLLAIPGVVAQGILGNIDYVAGIALVIGTIPGAYFGAKLVKHIPERALRLIFAGFLVIAAILLVVNEFVG